MPDAVIKQADLSEILDELNASYTANPFTAFEPLWTALVKISRLRARAAIEHEQIASTLRALSRDSASIVIGDQSVDTLLNLKPPLEELRTSPEEQLNPDRTARELRRVLTRRRTDPKAALAALFEVAERIRDRRVHALKRMADDRDMIILNAGVRLLVRVVTELILTLGKRGETKQLSSEWLKYLRAA